MRWSVAAPNLLIGLREGLEAGLIVTILLGSVRKLAPQRSLAGVWVGVASAAAISLSFGAVLTFTRAELSPRTQGIFGGITSLLAVCLVTWMIFWMRRAARGVAGELRGKVGRALLAGGPALAATAFIAVAREGLETALFVWTNAQAARSSTSPLVGALAGLVLAGVICTLLYRKVAKINLGRLFAITGAALLVIVAGVLAYGVGDLQEVGVLPGHTNTAFDVSANIPNGTWWSEAIRGVTNLETRMSWLQVLTYVAYLALGLPLFLRRFQPASAAAPAAPATPAADHALGAGRVGKSRRPRWIGAALAVVLPVAAAGAWVAVDGRASRPGGTALVVTASQCAQGWAAPTAGRSTYSITNSSGHAADIELVQSGGQAIIAEIEVLGPGTTRSVSVQLGSGEVTWRCSFDGLPALASASLAVREADSAKAQTPALMPTTAADLAPALARYRVFVGKQLALLKAQVSRLDRSVNGGDRALAKRDWLTAHLTYHRIGAAYDAFGAAGDAVDGLAQGLPAGTGDPDFVGFHKIELDLWSGRALSRIAPEVSALATAVTDLDTKLPSFTFDPNDVTIRAHEILEDTLRFTLTGQDDYGSGTGYATAQADLDGDRLLVSLLASLLDQRSPGITRGITADMDTLQRALAAASGTPVNRAPLAVRQRVNAAAGALLERLAPVPDLLEIRAN